MAEPSLTLSVIVAMSKNRVIGRDNALPWHLPADLALFKRLTLDKPMIMGRKTYESIGRALPGRTSIVVTHQKEWQAESVLVAHSLDDALELAKQDALVRGAAEIMIIGGADLFSQALPLCNRIYLTEVQTELEGDALFPPIAMGQWTCVAQQTHQADEKHAYGFIFMQLER